jgi:hypothetical protein
MEDLRGKLSELSKQFASVGFKFYFVKAGSSFIVDNTDCKSRAAGTQK